MQTIILRITELEPTEKYLVIYVYDYESQIFNTREVLKSDKQRWYMYAFLSTVWKIRKKLQYKSILSIL